MTIVGNDKNKKNQKVVSSEEKIKCISRHFGYISGMDVRMTSDDFHWGLQWVFSKKVDDLFRENEDKLVIGIMNEYQKIDVNRMICGMDYSKIKNGEGPMSKKEIEDLKELMTIVDDVDLSSN